LENHRAQIAALFEMRPIDAMEFHKKTLALITKLLLAKPSRAGAPETTEARMESYDIALDDIPFWAVASAIRKWHRGECDIRNFVSSTVQQPFDYRWAPESADLRKIALREIREPKSRIEMIDRILSATPSGDRILFNVRPDKFGGKATCAIDVALVPND
jgi:hypothetical protein